MITASDAVLVAASFFGLGGAAFGPAEPMPDPALGAVSGAEPPASVDLLSRGELYFEAVAEALKQKGYLDS